MNKVRITLLLFAITVLVSSCTGQHNSQASRGSSLLNEAEYLLETREFQKAENTGFKALEKINLALSSKPHNADYLLLRARSYFLLFLAKNTLVMENAPERPNSLVKIPNFWDYIDFDKTIPLAERDLKAVLDLEKSLSLEQKSAVWGMLGSIYRLNSSTLENSNENYKKAISFIEQWLYDLEHSSSKIKNKSFALERAKKQIQEMKMARVEVLLLAEKWDLALSILQEIMAGDDLKYFSIQYTLLENKISSLLKRLKEIDEHAKETREDKLRRLIAENRKKRHVENGTSSDLSPIEVELLNVEEKLTFTKNNLIYRIICYHNLRKKKELDETRNILRDFYPDIDEKLNLSLEKNRK